MSETERLLDYLWNTADVEAAIAVHDGGRVRELFRPDDPLALEIDEALAAPSLLQERDRLPSIDELATALEMRDVQKGGSPHITPGNRFYREEATAILANLPLQERDRLDVPTLRKALGVAFTKPYKYADGHLTAVLHDDAAERVAIEYARLAAASTTTEEPTDD